MFDNDEKLRQLLEHRATYNRLSMLNTPRKPQQQCVIPISAKLQPGETKEIAVEPTCIFRPERLIIAEVQNTWLGAISAFMRNLPMALMANFLALWSEHHACPGWKPPPYFPIDVLQFKVGSANQFRPNFQMIPGEVFSRSANQFRPNFQMIPGEVFSLHAFAINGRFDTCKIGEKLTLTIRSRAKWTIMFRAGIIGTTID